MYASPIGGRVLDASRLDRIPPHDGNGGKRHYRPANEGIREWDPKPRPGNVIMITERVAPSIRTAVGWLYPLEHYDERLSLDPLSQYAELLILMGSRGPADIQSVRAILKEARDRLSDPEYAKLRGYVDLLMVGRVDVPPELRRETTPGAGATRAASFPSLLPDRRP